MWTRCGRPVHCRRAAVDERCGQDGDEQHHRHVDRTGPDDVDEEVPGPHPDGDPDRELGDAARLAVGGEPQGDPGRRRGEERELVAEAVSGDREGEPGRDARQEHGDQGTTDPSPPLAPPGLQDEVEPHVRVGGRRPRVTWGAVRTAGVWSGLTTISWAAATAPS